MNDRFPHHGTTAREGIGSAGLAAQQSQQATAKITRIDELEKNLADLHAHLEDLENCFGAHLLPESAALGSATGVTPEPMQSSHNARLSQCNYSVLRLIAEVKTLCQRYEG